MFITGLELKKIKNDGMGYGAYSELGYEPLPCIGDKSEAYGYNQAILNMEETIAVGFGRALLTKNKECVYMYNDMTESGCGNCITVHQAEEIAAADSKNDWRIHLIAPLSERHYQRQGRQEWVLYKKGAGFA